MNSKALITLMISVSLTIIMNMASAKGGNTPKGQSVTGAEHSEFGRNMKYSKGYCESATRDNGRGGGSGLDRDCGGDDVPLSDISASSCEAVPLSEDPYDEIFWIGEVCSTDLALIDEFYFDFGDAEQACFSEGGEFYIGEAMIDEELNENGAYNITIDVECMPLA